MDLCTSHHIINQRISPAEARQYLSLNAGSPLNFPLCENCIHSLRKIIAAEEADAQARKARIKT